MHVRDLSVPIQICLLYRYIPIGIGLRTNIHGSVTGINLCIHLSIYRQISSYGLFDDRCYTIIPNDKNVSNRYA